MTNIALETALQGLALGGFRFLESTASTNDVALGWAALGAPDFSLVVADEQVSGRGREGRKWFTQTGSGLAFSLVLRPTENEGAHIARFSALGALALVNALVKMGLPAQVKWPNDVLIRRKKVAGILIETNWLGSQVQSLILGMGVNVLPGSLPPHELVNFPAACVETELGSRVDRFTLLADLLKELVELRKELTLAKFVLDWQDVLAFRGERVHIWQGGENSFIAELIGLDGDGSLQVRMDDGQSKTIHFGEVHLRPNNF